ncbi:Isopenicillin N synthase [Amycolatopsis tolypomycina]|uniref:Isopenicillin N synthase n=1 Tax=Amycolatopsis tolypomycina TaxID=208445 RepID=A0A1H4YWZ7_9PSEU|nr:2OG-Fe(II) oxygenase family protein [Amycolatopsis tolypomycina]SED21541.1 Isopenicillin N synthase [Amycolatopsis tolypomycina]
MVDDGFVPVIDLRGSRSGSAGQRRALAHRIGRVCETSGFFVVTGHGVPDAAVAELMAGVSSFFALPVAVKHELLSHPRDPLMRGYGRAGSLAASNGVTKRAGVLPDLSQTYTVNRLGEPEGAALLPPGTSPLVGLPNRWPDIRGFSAAFRGYYAEMERLAADLMRLFAIALDLEEHWFDDKTDKHMSNLVANYYPPQLVPPVPGQTRKGEHSDWGSLTILHRDEAAGGLQVLGRGKKWLDVPSVAGGLVINIGDLMETWTNGKWVSTVHRVVNPPRDKALTERYSIAFFHQPNFDALIECIPTCTDGANPPRYPAVRSGPYLMRKTLMSFDLE